MTDTPLVNGIPQIGFGTWERRGSACVETVLWALEAGYRHIDTAYGYKNEAEVGEALAASGLPREAYFVTTKVPPEFLAPGKVEGIVDASLDALGLDHVDLALVHWPAIDDAYEVADYMAQFAEIKASGRAKRIGVSNFTKRHMDLAIEAVGAAAIATNQCELHVLMQNRVIAGHCQAQGIPMTAYCPMAKGEVTRLAGLQSIAEAHGATAGQVALAFLMAEGHIVIPSSSNKARIIENLGARDVRLSEADIVAIRAMDQGKRLLNASWAPEWDPAN